MLLASRFLDALGTGLGSINMNVNGSVTPQEFKVTAADDELLEIKRLIFFVRDDRGFDAAGFGAGVALANGIEIYKEFDNGDTINLMTQKSIKTNCDFAAYCYDVTLWEFGLGDEFLAARYTFTKDGASIILRPGDSVVCQINDNCSAINEMHMKLGMVSSKYKR